VPISPGIASSQYLTAMRPDDQWRQLNLFRCCSGNNNISMSSFKQADRQPEEELWDKAQLSFQQFLQGLPKNSSPNLNE